LLVSLHWMSDMLFLLITAFFRGSMKIINAADMNIKSIPLPVNDHVIMLTLMFKAVQSQLSHIMASVETDHISQVVKIVCKLLCCITRVYDVTYLMLRCFLDPQHAATTQRRLGMTKMRITIVSLEHLSSPLGKVRCLGGPNVLANPLNPVAELVDTAIPLPQSTPHALDLLHIQHLGLHPIDPRDFCHLIDCAPQ
jgi:hypothetical protein